VRRDRFLESDLPSGIRFGVNASRILRPISLQESLKHALDGHLIPPADEYVRTHVDASEVPNTCL
jgi:hypothetical protein